MEINTNLILTSASELSGAVFMFKKRDLFMLQIAFMLINTSIDETGSIFDEIGFFGGFFLCYNKYISVGREVLLHRVKRCAQPQYSKIKEEQT